MSAEREPPRPAAGRGGDELTAGFARRAEYPATVTSARCVGCGQPAATLGPTEITSQFPTCRHCRFRDRHQAHRQFWARGMLVEIAAVAADGLVGLYSLDHAAAVIARLATTLELEYLAAPIEPEHPDWRHAA